jgi:hypothetical protein
MQLTIELEQEEDGRTPDPRLYSHPMADNARQT